MARQLLQPHCRTVAASDPKQEPAVERKLRLQLGAAPVVTELLTGFVIGLPVTPAQPPRREERV